jgi:hypothetical protein
VAPFVTADGLAIFFASDRPLSAASVDFTKFDIWTASYHFLANSSNEPVRVQVQGLPPAAIMAESLFG